MNNLLQTNEKIPLIQLIANGCFLIISFFYFSGLLLNLLIIVNVVLSATMVIIKKYEPLFNTLIQTKRVAQLLNTNLGKLN